MGGCWERWGLEPASDERAIRSACGRAAGRFHPEEQPEESKEIRAAYEETLRQAAGTAGRRETAGPERRSLKTEKESEKDKGYSHGRWNQEESPYAGCPAMVRFWELYRIRREPFSHELFRKVDETFKL